MSGQERRERIKMGAEKKEKKRKGKKSTTGRGKKRERRNKRKWKQRPKIKSVKRCEGLRRKRETCER